MLRTSGAPLFVSYHWEVSHPRSLFAFATGLCRRVCADAVARESPCQSRTSPRSQSRHGSQKTLRVNSTRRPRRAPRPACGCVWPACGRHPPPMEAKGGASGRAGAPGLRFSEPVMIRNSVPTEPRAGPTAGGRGVPGTGTIGFADTAHWRPDAGLSPPAARRRRGEKPG